MNENRLRNLLCKHAKLFSVIEENYIDKGRLAAWIYRCNKCHKKVLGIGDAEHNIEFMIPIKYWEIIIKNNIHQNEILFENLYQKYGSRLIDYKFALK